jgi:hypothetical protein
MDELQVRIVAFAAASIGPAKKMSRQGTSTRVGRETKGKQQATDASRGWEDGS